MFTKSYDIKTPDRDALLDITDKVQKAVSDFGVKEGIVYIFVPHTTAGVTINENADPSVIHDTLAALDRAVPWSSPDYRHGEGNSAAHVKSSLVGCSACLPVMDGKLTLGTWQGVFFCEFDGPRHRRFSVSILS